MNPDPASTGGVRNLSCPKCEAELPTLHRGFEYCPYCGEKISVIRCCKQCGRPEEQPVTAAKQGEATRPRRREETGTSDGSTAAILAIVPGLGQVYNGQFFRGLGFFVGTTTLLGSVVLVPAGLGLWAYSVWHAHRVASSGTAVRPRRPARPLYEVRA